MKKFTATEKMTGTDGKQYNVAYAVSISLTSVSPASIVPTPPPVVPPVVTHPPVTPPVFPPASAAAWPSAANRPVFDQTTKILTWVGPADGGPSTPGDSVQTKTLLMASSMSSTAGGQIIEGLAIIGGNPRCITINHNNVTVRRCYIKGPGGSDKYNISIAPGVNGTVVEDCEIDGAGAQADSGSFNVIGYGGALTNMTYRRCNAHGAEQMISRTMRNVTIVDNYFHDTQGQDADMVEIYVDSGDSHDILIQNNTFQDPGRPGFNSAINMSNWVAPNSIYRVTIDGNRFLVPDYPHVFCDDNRQGSGKVNYAATNNGFISTIKAVQTGDNNGISPNSGNFVLADTNDATKSGLPFNGNGAI